MSLKIAILVSGRGSNMTAILEAIDAGRLDAKVEFVFSNKPDAPALSIAAERGIQTFALCHRGMKREEHEREMLKIFEKFELDLIVLAGYMRVLSPVFLHAFRDERGFFRVLNIHPSLLPAFPGAHAYEDAFNYGVRLAGITVHLVDEKVDHGPILAQASFERLEDDDLESFKARGLALEHRLFPEVLQKISMHGFLLLERKENPVLEKTMSQAGAKPAGGETNAVKAEALSK